MLTIAALAFVVSSGAPDDALCLPTADDSGIACVLGKQGDELHGCTKGRKGRHIRKQRKATIFLAWDIETNGRVSQVWTRGRKFRLGKAVAKCLGREIRSWDFVPPNERQMIRGVKLVVQ